MGEKINIELLHPLEIKSLLAFESGDSLTHADLESKTSLDAARIRRAVEWLLTRKAVDVLEEKIISYVVLTDVGMHYAEKQIPELRILDLAENGISMDAIRASNDFDPAEIGPAIGSLKKNKLISFGANGAILVNPDGDRTEYTRLQKLVETYSGTGEVQLDTLSRSEREELEMHSRKRGKAKGIFRIRDRSIRTFGLTELGRKLLSGVQEYGLTGDEKSKVEPADLKDGAWRNIHYRKYALDLKPPRMVTGKRNPYREFLDFVKRKLTTMGFEEMTGSHVEPEFWNMDALFMPQFHSARDIHDVYFVKSPTHASSIEEPFLSKVSDVHTNGGDTGSKGWNYQFSETRTRQLLLRSQGTALSARQLHKAKVPGKYFAMARCFRYDGVDATHAADFFQVEGIVLGRDINFRTLLGLLKMFAFEVARAEEIKFAPAYFPFTEPSVEAHIKHPVIGWMEMGGAGIFRPEVTKPQGIDVPVIAWGLGLDRMAMVAMGIDDIRDLFATDLNQIRSRRIYIRE